jgi:tetratricopeptide (TPR) repeat protein
MNPGNKRSCEVLPLRKPWFLDRGGFAKTLCVVLGLILVLFVFRPFMQVQFLSLDDPQYIAQNPLLRLSGWHAVRRICESFYFGQYQPLVHLSYLLERHFLGGDPFVYRFTNILLHVVNVGLVYAWISRLTKSRLTGAVTALLFGVHPLRAESVVWLSARKDVLFGFFYLLGLNSYLAYVRTCRRKDYAFSGIFFFLSLLSKPAMAVTWPLLAVLVDGYEGRWNKRAVWFEKIPFFFLSLVFGLIVFVAARSFPLIVLPAHSSIAFRVACSCSAILFYAARILCPVRLSAVYAWPLGGQMEGAAVFFALLLLCFPYAAKRLTPAVRRDVFFGIGVFLAGILPVLHLSAAGQTMFAADRYTYIASIGLSYLAARGVAGLVSARRMFFAGFLTAIVVFALGVSTWQRTAIWKNNGVFWTDVLTKCPLFIDAYLNRGDYFEEQKDDDRALKDYGAGMEIATRFFEVDQGVESGAIDEQRGWSDDPFLQNESFFIKDVDPRSRFLVKMALAYASKGEYAASAVRLKKAMDYFEAVGYFPSDISLQGYLLMGFLKQMSGDLGEAEAYYRRAWEIYPPYATVFKNKAYAYITIGRPGEAVALLRGLKVNAMGIHSFMICGGNDAAIAGSVNERRDDVQEKP